MKRYASFLVFLGTAHFSTAQTTGQTNFDTLSTALHCIGRSLLESLAERSAANQLTCNVLSDKRCIDFRTLNFLNLNLHLLGQLLLDVSTNLFDCSTFNTNNDTWACSMNNNSYTLWVTYDFNFSNVCIFAFRKIVHQLADFQVFQN